jgi:Planctomycete cytochrome C
MKRFGSSKLLVICGLLELAGLYYFFSASRSKIDFNTQVKPILNKNCIACHGGVRQKAGYSLLFRSEAPAPAKSGKLAIIPGNASG